MRAGTSQIANFPSSCAPVREWFSFSSVTRHLDNDAAAPSFPRSPGLLPPKVPPPWVEGAASVGRSPGLRIFHI